MAAGLGKNSCHVIIAAAVDEGNKVTNTFRKAIIIRQVPSTGLRTITNARFSLIGTNVDSAAEVIGLYRREVIHGRRRKVEIRGYRRLKIPAKSKRRNPSNAKANRRRIEPNAIRRRQRPPRRRRRRTWIGKGYARIASVAAREPQCRGQTNAFAPTVREKGHRAKSTHIPEMIENTTNTTNPTGTVAAGGKPYFAKRSRKFV